MRSNEFCCVFFTWPCRIALLSKSQGAYNMSFGTCAERSRADFNHTFLKLKNYSNRGKCSKFDVGLQHLPVEETSNVRRHSLAKNSCLYYPRRPALLCIALQMGVTIISN
ncbi:hypothetical protein M404DRAFT_538094 [Pisolithus tinctorius Marx 270]|uniref:Uncharacterized protein n=1 Tax=Pisolithus tinctorius Marx 270 TaxID=870435 RepID=A0A0C3PA08_PISTI|nr:hypothetical protein M404DRAFT_538094 [Pisolithus tinctorius Marx 270]